MSSYENRVLILKDSKYIHRKYISGWNNISTNKLDTDSGIKTEVLYTKWRTQKELGSKTAAEVQRQEAVSKSKEENLIVKDNSRNQQRAWNFNLS